MKKTQFLVLALSLVVLASCGGKKENSTNQDSTKTQTSEQSGNKENMGPYKVEKGTITYEMETMGMKSIINLYWKNFGTISCNETIIEMMGVKSTNIVLTKDGFVISYDLSSKTGRKTKVPTDAVVDYSNLDSEMMQKMNIKEEGKEDILGKPCVIYSMEYMGVKSKSWVWNGIALKTESNAAGMPMTMIVKSMDVDNDPPAEKFEVPSGIKIMDAASGK